MNSEIDSSAVDLPSKLNRDPGAPETPVGLEAEDRAPKAAFTDEEAGITEADQRPILGMRLLPGHLLCRRLVRGRHGQLVLPKNLTKPGDYFLVVSHSLSKEDKDVLGDAPITIGSIVLASSFAGTTVSYKDDNFILLVFQDVKGRLYPGSEADEFFRANYCVTNRLDAV